MDIMLGFEPSGVGSIPAGPARGVLNMKPITFRNRLNNEQVVCQDTRDVKFIDGVEYLVVHKPNSARTFMMRRDALERVPSSTASRSYR